MQRIVIGALLGALLMGLPGLAQEDASVTHVVQTGETLFRIALNHNTTVQAIMLANDLSSPNLIYTGQVLAIPQTGPAHQSVSAPATHTVQAGENLFRISRGYGVSMNAIMATNGIADPDRLYVGQVLAIPAGGMPEAAQEAPQAKHTVQAGENLFRIALRYGVSVDALAAANGIQNTAQIYAGQVLAIPGAAPADAPQPQAEAPAPDRVYLNVPVVRQTHNLSCESASACSLLLHMGYPCLDDMHVFGALPQSYDNPHRGFVGPVTGAPGSLPPGAANAKTGGYGVYTEPLHAALTGLGVRSDYTYFSTLDALREKLRAGVPVLIIATHGLGIYGSAPVLFTPTEGDGEQVTVIRYEHSYTLIGYDAGGFWAIDPWSGGVDYFTSAQLDADWARLGRQALWVLPPE